MPVVRIPEVLRRYAEGEPSARVEGGTVAAALDALFARYPDLRPRVLDAGGSLFAHLRLFVDGRETRDPTAPLGASSTLDVVVAAGGG